MKISVVIDNHNYGRFLGDALDSVLDQGVPAEVIVADDGSTDDSRGILKAYAKRGVKALLQERQGQATAFNNGLAAATGDVVCLLDSDDVFLPGKLKAVAAAFADPKVVCVQHFLHDTDAKLAPLPRRFPAWPARYTLDDYVAGRTQFTATSGLAFRRVTLEKLLPIPKDLFYYLDDFLTAHALFHGEIANIPEVYGLHRQHGDNWCAGDWRTRPRSSATSSTGPTTAPTATSGWRSADSSAPPRRSPRRRSISGAGASCSRP
ncbi:MAG: glycosyltransferase [Elusimicrobiota bacterium]|nr:MAG: glycosyltransferase [Elusimicrobiota bacterium]